jgi:glycosyltransferase involved in cell wall biosynthesis
MSEVTVVLPTHDRDALLREAVASVLAQARTAARVIVSDDRGAASTRTVVEELSRGAAVPVEYVDSSGPGAGTAGASRNAGAGSVTTPLVAFLDDDDLWHPQFLARTCGALEDAGADFAVAWTRADRPGYEMATMVEGLTVGDVVGRNPGFVGSNFVMTTRAFRRLGGFDGSLTVSNDKDLLVRALEAGLRYVVVDDFLVTNRIHGEGQLTDKSPRREAGIQRYMEKHATLLSRRDRWFLRSQLASVRRATSPTRFGRVWSGAEVAFTRTLLRATSLR